MPEGLLTTIAECAIAFAGFSALGVIVPQLAGVPWRGQMATGLWLMVSWSLTAFVFSLIPLVIHEFGLSADRSFAWSSGMLAFAILVQGGLSANRDRKLAKAGMARPTERRVLGAGAFASVVVVGLFLNCAGILPGDPHAWYLVSLLLLFVFAAVPLSLFLEQLTTDS